jgi:hypothetical protein
MERETTTLSIGQHTFKVKTYATAREMNAIQSVFFKNTKAEIVGDAPRINDFDLSSEYQLRLEMVRQLVVAMDDNTENIVDRCEDLPSHTFMELTKALDDLVKKKGTA